VRREQVGGAQAVEDAACLVFIETQLASLAARMDHQLMLEVIRKTARKMSTSGLDLVASIPLDDSARALLDEALGESTA
jgi:tRNAThr (cytosine32-N3)-methyltransferase